MKASPVKRFAKILAPLAIIAVAMVIVFFLVTNSPPANQQAVINRLPLIQSIVAKSENIRVPVHTRGIVAPRASVTLISEVSGTVIDVSPQFNSGGFFSKGDVLVRIDPAYYQLEIIKRRRAVDAAIVLVAEVTARAHVARKGAKTGATDFALHIPQVNDAKSQLAAAHADLSLAQLKLVQTEIKAPFDGRVKITRINKDQFVSAGEMLADIYALAVVEIRLPISDHHLSLIDLPSQYLDELSNEADFPRVTVTSLIGGKSYNWEGQVVRSEGGLDANRLLYVVAEIKDPFQRDATIHKRPPLEIGRFVEARIDGKKQENVVVIPREALRGQHNVWLVDKDDRLVIRKVDVLYRGRDQVYIREGIESGESVVLTALDFAVHGMKVRRADSKDNSTL